MSLILSVHCNPIQLQKLYSHNNLRSTGARSSEQLGENYEKDNFKSSPRDWTDQGLSIGTNSNNSILLSNNNYSSLLGNNSILLGNKNYSAMFGDNKSSAFLTNNNYPTIVAQQDCRWGTNDSLVQWLLGYWLTAECTT